MKEPSNFVETFLFENRLSITWLAYKLGMLPQTLSYKVRKRTDEQLRHTFSAFEYEKLLEVVGDTGKHFTY